MLFALEITLKTPVSTSAGSHERDQTPKRRALRTQKERGGKKTYKQLIIHILSHKQKALRKNPRAIRAHLYVFKETFS